MDAGDPPDAATVEGTSGPGDRLDPRKPEGDQPLGKTIRFVGTFVLATIVVPIALAQAFGLLFIGPLQLVWGIPVAIYAHVTKRPRLFRVTLIAAGIVFLLNVTCTAIVFSTTRFGG